jgi:hypothetical protein
MEGVIGQIHPKEIYEYIIANKYPKQNQQQSDSNQPKFKI